VLFAVGALPLNDEREFPAAHVTALARELSAKARGPARTRTPAGGDLLAAGRGAALPAVLDAVLEPEMPGLDATPLRVVRRREGTRDLHFVINDGAQAWSGALTTRSTGAVEVLDPLTGAVRTAPDPHAVPLELAPYGAAFLRAPAAPPPARLPVANGALPGLTSVRWPPALRAKLRTVRADRAHHRHRARHVGRARHAHLDRRGHLSLRVVPVRRGSLARARAGRGSPQRAGQPAPAAADLRARSRRVQCKADTGRSLDEPAPAFCSCRAADSSRPSPRTARSSRSTGVPSWRSGCGWGGFRGRAGDVVAFGLGAPRLLERTTGTLTGDEASRARGALARARCGTAMSKRPSSVEAARRSA